AERELAALPPDLAAHARLLATLGAEVAPQELEGVLKELEPAAAADYPLDATIGIDRLRQRGVVVTHRSNRVGFRHALVREAIARAVPDAARTHIHRAAFRFFRDAPADAEGERLGKLALHASQCGLHEEACTAYLDLADRARGRHAYLEAEAMY